MPGTRQHNAGHDESILFRGLYFLPVVAPYGAIDRALFAELVARGF
jgi:hypothetical protein